MRNENLLIFLVLLTIPTIFAEEDRKPVETTGNAETQDSLDSENSTEVPRIHGNSTESEDASVEEEPTVSEASDDLLGMQDTSTESKKHPRSPQSNAPQPAPFPASSMLHLTPLETLENYSCQKEAAIFGHDEAAGTTAHEILCELRKLWHYLLIAGHNLRSQLPSNSVNNPEEHEAPVNVSPSEALSSVMENGPTMMRSLMENPDNLMALPHVIKHSVPLSEISETFHRLRTSSEKFMSHVQDLYVHHTSNGQSISPDEANILQFLREELPMMENKMMSVFQQQLGNSQFAKTVDSMIPKTLMSESMIGQLDNVRVSMFQYLKFLKAFMSIMQSAYQGYNASGLPHAVSTAQRMFGGSTAAALSSGLLNMPAVSSIVSGHGPATLSTAASNLIPAILPSPQSSLTKDAATASSSSSTAVVCAEPSTPVSKVEQVGQAGQVHRVNENEQNDDAEGSSTSPVSVVAPSSFKLPLGAIEPPTAPSNTSVVTNVTSTVISIQKPVPPVASSVPVKPSSLDSAPQSLSSVSSSVSTGSSDAKPSFPSALKDPREDERTFAAPNRYYDRIPILSVSNQNSQSLPPSHSLESPQVPSVIASSSSSSSSSSVSEAIISQQPSQNDRAPVYPYQPAISQNSPSYHPQSPSTITTVTSSSSSSSGATVFQPLSNEGYPPYHTNPQNSLNYPSASSSTSSGVPQFPEPPNAKVNSPNRFAPFNNPPAYSNIDEASVSSSSTSNDPEFIANHQYYNQPDVPHVPPNPSYPNNPSNFPQGYPYPSTSSTNIQNPNANLSPENPSHSNDPYLSPEYQRVPSYSGNVQHVSSNVPPQIPQNPNNPNFPPESLYPPIPSSAYQNSSINVPPQTPGSNKVENSSSSLENSGSTSSIVPPKNGEVSEVSSTITATSSSSVSTSSVTPVKTYYSTSSVAVPVTSNSDSSKVSSSSVSSTSSSSSDASSSTKGTIPGSQFSVQLPRERIASALGKASLLPGDIISIPLRNVTLLGRVVDEVSPINFNLSRPISLTPKFLRGRRILRLFPQDLKDPECQRKLTSLLQNMHY